MCDCVEDLTVRHFPVLVQVVTRSSDQAILGCDAISCSRRSVADLAVDLISFLTSSKQLPIYCDRNSGAPHISHLSCQAIRLICCDMEWNRSVGWNPIDPTFGENRRRSLRFIFWLAIHVRKNFDWGSLSEIPAEASNCHNGKADGAKDCEEGADEALHATPSARTGWGSSSGS